MSFRFGRRTAGRIASVVAFVSALAALTAPAAAQRSHVTGAYEGPVYSVPSAFAATVAPRFTFTVPNGYYVAAAAHPTNDAHGTAGAGPIALFLDHTGDASCLAWFACDVTGGAALPIHFTPQELAAISDPRALTAYLQHLDYVAPATLGPSAVQTVAVTPEPGSRALLATGLTGLAGVGVVRRRRG